MEMADIIMSDIIDHLRLTQYVHNTYCVHTLYSIWASQDMGLILYIRA